MDAMAKFKSLMHLNSITKFDRLMLNAATFIGILGYSPHFLGQVFPAKGQITPFFSVTW